MLKVGKIVGLCQAAAIVLIATLCLRMSYSDSIVVISNGKEKIFATGLKERSKIEKPDVEKFVSDFIRSRYEWDEFNSSAILTRVGPYVSDGFYQKMVAELKKESERTIKGKRVKQVSADIQVNVTEKDVTASFFKLLIVEGIPLPITTEIAFDLTQGTVTRANPIGIYVNGIVEREIGLK